MIEEEPPVTCSPSTLPMLSIIVRCASAASPRSKCGGNALSAIMAEL